MMKCQAIISNHYFNNNGRISVHTLSNAQKSLGGHAKISMTSPLLSQSNFIWHKNVDRHIE